MIQKIKNGVITRYDFKLFAHNAVRFDNWVVLQKLNPSYDVKADGSIDPYRQKRIYETSRCILSIKIFIAYVGKIPQYVTLTCSDCQLKGKPIAIGKMFGYKMLFSKIVWILV